MRRLRISYYTVRLRRNQKLLLVRNMVSTKNVFVFMGDILTNKLSQGAFCITVQARKEASTHRRNKLENRRRLLTFV